MRGIIEREYVMSASDKPFCLLRNLHWIIVGVFVVAMLFSQRLSEMVQAAWFETVSLVTKLPDLLIWVWLPYIF